MRIALATSVPITHSDSELIAPLRERGFSASPVTWTDEGVDWSSWDAVVIRSCWNYHLRFSEFISWLDRLDSLGVPVINPMTLTRWNLSKRYLLELQSKGVRIPRTVFVDRGASPADIRCGLDEIGTPAVVVKPAVSASAHETWLIKPGDAAKVHALSREGDVLLQEFVAEVQTVGELSLVFFGGEYSHAMLKRPRAGDFRVQTEHGGSGVPASPPGSVTDAAAEVLAHLPVKSVFARIDGIVIREAFTLMEAELLDAELFMHVFPGSGARFADAIVESLRIGQCP